MLILLMILLTLVSCTDSGDTPSKPDLESSSSSLMPDDSCHEEGETCFLDNRDGQYYRVVQIGDRMWFAENLNYKDSNTSYEQSRFELLSSFCPRVDQDLFDSKLDCDRYGRFYAVGLVYDMENGFNPNLCPQGWHISTAEDWENLMDVSLSLGYGQNSIIPFASSDHWRDLPEESNSTQFSMLPVRYMGYFETNLSPLMWQFESYADAGFWMDSVVLYEGQFYPNYIKPFQFKFKIGVLYIGYDLPIALSIRCVKNL